MASAQFTSFDDSRQIIFIPTNSGSGGTNTLEVDPYRQGVELKTNRQRFASTQPKIWAGDFDHGIDVHTLGQARSFVEFNNSPLFFDIPIFDPVSFIILGTAYPRPIMFNEGPQQEEEAILMPLTIPFRKNSSNEGPFYAHRVAGEVEDGNNFDTIFKNSNRTTQFWDYLDPIQQRFFLDEGEAVWGPIGNGIVVEGFTAGQERLLRAFDDTAVSDIPQSTKASGDLLSVLNRLDMDLDEDLRPLRTRSANSNTFVYGRDSARYGTDSYAFLGILRGS